MIPIPLRGLNADELAALRALRDCGCIRAHWAHLGYSGLHSRRLVSYHPLQATQPSIDKRNWYLLSAGSRLASWLE